MAGPYTIDTTSPSDSSIISQYPTNERAHRTTVKGFLEEDHDATTGHHKFVILIEQTDDPAGVADMITLYNKEGVMMERIGTGTPTKAGGEWAAGTKVLFSQAAPPTGYTQDTTVTDRVLRVVSGTGGGTGGSWTISGITVDNHTLATARIPSHNHVYSNAGGLTARGTGSTSAADSSSGTTQSTGGSDPHNHGLTIGSAWRPAYTDVIVAAKD